MKRSIFLVVLLALPVFLGAVFPMPADAAFSIVPCGTSAHPEPCTLCHIVTGISGIVIYVRDIMVFVALAVITAMGILYIVSAGSPELMGMAKKGIIASLVGVVIVLFAWLIVNTIMFTVFGAKANLGISGVTFQGMNGFVFSCSTVSNVSP